MIDTQSKQKNKERKKETHHFNCLHILNHKDFDVIFFLHFLGDRFVNNQQK